MQHPKRENKPSRRAVEKMREVTDEIAEIWSGFESDPACTDVLGSYTGTPHDKTVHPVQDADDL